MTISEAPKVSAQMLIRRPVHDVFEAFVDPAITRRFWFTRSSGRVEPGARLRWDWEMYGASADVAVTEVEKDRRIRIEWSGEGTPPCPVEWTFAPRADGTLVTITNDGFVGTGDEIVAQAIDAMSGFTIVLAGLKALLEHDIDLRLIADHHPDAHRAR